MPFNEEKLKEILIRNAKRKSDFVNIVEDTDLVDDLGYDSIAIITLVSLLEKAFGIYIEGEEIDIDIIGKYGSLKEMILRKLAVEQTKEEHL